MALQETLVLVVGAVVLTFVLFLTKYKNANWAKTSKHQTFRNFHKFTLKTRKWARMDYCLQIGLKVFDKLGNIDNYREVKIENVYEPK